jgi:hypothetical protein
VTAPCSRWVHPYPLFVARAAIYVDKILKGERVANLPIERPSVFSMIVNLEAAKTLGLSVAPQCSLARRTHSARGYRIEAAYCPVPLRRVSGLAEDQDSLMARCEPRTVAAVRRAEEEWLSCSATLQRIPRGPLVIAAYCERRLQPRSAWGQEETHAAQQNVALLDYLVGHCKQCGRHLETECLGGLDVDRQLKLGGRLCWKIGRSGPLKMRST